MTCDRSAQVHAYHDDALGAPQRVAVEAHLEGCADCRALLAELRGLSNLIAAAPMAAISPQTMERITRGIRAARDRGVLRITTWLTAAAAAVLVAAPLLFHERATPQNPIVVANGDVAAWETVAVMPPSDVDENVPELVTLAQWMANDLSYGGERQ